MALNEVHFNLHTDQKIDMLVCDFMRSKKQGFIHAYPFLKVASVLASHCKASYWRVLPFNSSLISVCELQEYF